MAATKVTLGGTGGPFEVYSHVVYARPAWADDWTLQPTLHCDESVWGVAPSIPTASLHKYYGDISRQGTLHFSKEERESLLRAYVKVVYGTGLVWYGVIEVDEDDLDGARVWTDSQGTKHVIATGEQTFTVYGLEQLLATHVITTSAVMTGSGDFFEIIGRGITFNDRGRPNANANLLAFANDPDFVDYWTTRAIVYYLLDQQTPTDLAGVARVPFVLPFASAQKLPDWDHPELLQHHMTTYDLLTSLIARQRLLLWWLDVDETQTPNTVRLQVETVNRNEVDIGLTGSTPIPANSRLKHVVFDADASSRAVVKTTAVEKYDQFVVQGARRRSCFSLGFDDATLAIGWTAAQEVDYEAAARYASGLPAATEITARRKLHAEARSAEEVKDVYVRFVIPNDWNGKVGAGDGTTSVLPAFPVVEEDGTIAADPAPFFQVGLTVDQTLPLLEGVDYSDAAIATGLDESDSTGVERTPLVAWKIPGTSPVRWQNVEKIGRKADLETEDPDELATWSCEVSVPQNDRGIRLHVHGEPTHIIAKTDFTGRAEDDSTGDHDYRDMICTLSITEDRHAEGVWPPDTLLSVTADVLRVKTIDAGDSYRHDYVAPETVVDIDVNGALVRSDGGFFRDDTAELESIAFVAFQWYGTNRKVLSLATEVLTSALTLGDFIEEIGDDSVPDEGHNMTINSVVTEVRIATRRHEGQGEPDPPRQLITTGWGELDPLQLLTPEDAPIDASKTKDTAVSTFDVRRGV